MQHTKRPAVLALLLLLFCWPALAAPAPDASPCELGPEELDIKLFVLLGKAELASPELAAFQAELDACIKTAQAYSPGRRKKFAELTEDLIARIDAIILSLATADDSLAVGGQPRNKIASLQELKHALQLARLKLRRQLPLDHGWGRDFIANFYLGYEGTSVNGIQEKGTARTGMLVYNQVNGPLTKDHWGLHVFGNALLTSSAEQTREETTNTDTIEETIELDLNLSLLYGARYQSNGLLAFGLIGSLSTRKVDQLDDYTEKYLAGLRFAHSPESYFDILYGKTENVVGKRVELRGQLPVAEILNGNMFVGAILNLGIEDQATSNDSIRIYVTWQVNFADFFQRD